MSTREVEERILALLGERGPMQFYAIAAAVTANAQSWRHADAALQRLRRAGKIRVIPRKRHERPFPLWEIASPSVSES